MLSVANTKSLAGILGTGVTNGATVTANIDTLGFDHLSLDVIMGTSNTTSNNPSVLKLGESDDTVVTNFADITGFIGDTSFTIAAADTSTENIYRFDVDLRARKRYIRLTVSPTTTQATVYSARLARAETSVDTSATLAGVENLVRG